MLMSSTQSDTAEPDTVTQHSLLLVGALRNTINALYFKILNFLN